MFWGIIMKVQMVFILLWQRQRWQMADYLQFTKHSMTRIRVGGRSSQVV